MAAQAYAATLEDLGYTIGEQCDDSEYRDTVRLKYGNGVETFALHIWYKSGLPQGYREVMFNDPVTWFPPLDHKNVAKVIQIFETQTTILVILRYPRDPKSTLEEEWNQWDDKLIPHFLSKKWLHGVAQGLAYLHTQGFAHRNLSASNILIKSRNTAQISDYSLVPVANQVVPFENFEVILRPPRAPDQIVDHFKDDVWTFGVLLFLLMGQTHEALVEHPDPDHDADEWDPQEYNQLLVEQEGQWQTYAFINCHHPQGAKELLMKILWVDPSLRCTMETVASDEWLQSEEPVEAASSGAKAVRNEASVLYNPLSDKLRNKIKSRGIKFLNFISKGGYGAVYRVQLTDKDRYAAYNNQIAALKICNLKDANEDYREVFSVRERYLIGNVEHENIIKCLEIIGDSNRHFCIVMEIAKSDLRSVIRDERKRPKPYEEMEAKMKKYLFDICKGMAHLHSVGWSHRDMKPDNCLIRPDDTAVITDFSFGKRVNEGHLSDTFCGTYNYRSPQILMHVPYSPQAADVWAIGCTIYESLVHRYLINMDRNLDSNGRAEIIHGRTVKVTGDPNLSGLASNLIYNCLWWNEEDRLTMSNVLDYPFFSSLQPAPGPSSGAKDGSKEASTARGTPKKEGSKTSSGKAASSGPSTKQTMVPVAGPSGLHQVKAGTKRKKEDSPQDTSS